MRAPMLAPILAFAVAATAGVVPVAAQGALKSKVEAAILSKFPQFVDWPAGTFTGRATIDLCVVAGDTMQRDLQDVVSDERIGGRTLAVRRVDREAELSGCHLLFVPATAIPSHRSLLKRAASLPVLTVSDGDGFLEDGGIVRLREVDGRVRFDVDTASAARAGLRISSQLLQLAASVKGGPA
jgi:hypothetical protein